jgi:anti-anti-sigma factor
VSAGESYYRFESADSCLIVTLLPVLNDKQWADIEKVGTEIVERLSAVQSPRLIVDLTLLSYMGSAMVALIVRLYKAVNGRNGQMVVVNQHELVFEVLKLAGLTKLWTIVNNRDEAYASLGVRRRAAAVEGAPSSGGSGLLIAGVLGTIGAIVGLALQFAPHPPVPHKVALLIDVGFAALGMVVGTMMLVNQTGARRNVGIVFLAICLIAVLGGIVVSPEQSPAPKGASSNASPAPVTTTAAVATTAVSTTATPTTAPPTKADPPAASQPATAGQSGKKKQKDK